MAGTEADSQDVFFQGPPHKPWCGGGERETWTPPLQICPAVLQRPPGQPFPSLSLSMPYAGMTDKELSRRARLGWRRRRSLGDICSISIHHFACSHFCISLIGNGGIADVLVTMATRGFLSSGLITCSALGFP